VRKSAEASIMFGTDTTYGTFVTVKNLLHGHYRKSHQIKSEMRGKQRDGLKTKELGIEEKLHRKKSENKIIFKP